MPDATAGIEELRAVAASGGYVGSVYLRRALGVIDALLLDTEAVRLLSRVREVYRDPSMTSCKTPSGWGVYSWDTSKMPTWPACATEVEALRKAIGAAPP